MLHRLEIENFFSIRDPQVIDLRAAGNAPDEFGQLAPLWPDTLERAPKVVALFGANASGKSNVLKAISFLAWFMKDSFRAAPEAGLPYARFKDLDARNGQTRLAMYFVGPADLSRAEDADAPACRYVYEVSLGGPEGKPEQVLVEALRYWPRDGARQIRLFERDHTGAVHAGKAFALAGYRQALERILRPNASVISTLMQLNHPLSNTLAKNAATVSYNILHEKAELDEGFLARHYGNNPKHLELLNRDMERIGLGVRAMRLQHGANGPIALFDHEGLAEPLPAQLESHGTRQFVWIFPLIANAIENGGVAVIDELDLAIHPLVLPEIIRWFHDPKRNPQNAQLWMTCQNASLLEALTKEEIWFCEKDPRGRTSVYGLRDVQAVRRDDNHYRKYLGGVYGAVPHLG